MKLIPAPVRKLAYDSLPYSQTGTAAQARAIKASGATVVVGYLGVIDAIRLNNILGAGLGFWAVTLAGHSDGPATVRDMQALGLPSATPVFLDLEGLTAFHTDPKLLIATIDAWGLAVTKAGFLPGLYVGSPQPLTSDELWHLNVYLYWRGQGRIVDRFNKLAEPTGCGWCLTQAYPSGIEGGVLVDADLIGQDYLGRVPSMVVA